MKTTTEVSSYLDDLCKSSARFLRKRNVYGQDHLLIKSHPEDSDLFIIEPVALRFTPHPDEYDLSREHIQIDEKFFIKNFYGPSGAILGFIKDIPEAKQTKGQTSYTCPITDYTCLMINSCLSSERVLWMDEFSELSYKTTLARFAADTIVAKRISDLKSKERIVAALPSDFLDHPDLGLSDYQGVATLNSLFNPSYALFMEQGTGKTAIVIARICYEASQKRKDEDKIYRVLVVCPKQVRYNWEREVSRFAVTAGKITALRGGELRRTRNLVESVADEKDCDWTVTVCSYDSLQGTKALKAVPWDLVVFDESHYMKNPRSKRFLAAREIVSRSKQVMSLTGTPIGNSIFDMWSQLEVLGKGVSGFHKFETFRRFYGKWKKTDGSSVERLISVDNIPLFQERLARKAFMYKKSEARLGLPDKVFDLIEVDMTKKQSDIYKEVATRLIIEMEEKLENAEPSKKHLVIENILTQMLRLAQITSGHIKWDEQRDPATGAMIRESYLEQIDTVNPKVEVIAQVLKEEWESDPKSKKLIWACFVEDIKVLSKKFTEMGVLHGTYYGATSDAQRQENVRLFNEDPDFKLLILNPASAGEGLNLLGYDYTDPDSSDTYCDHSIYMSRNWSMIQRSQSEDRAHRRGARVTLRISDVVVLGTVDEEIIQRVVEKRQMALGIQDVRNILDQMTKLIA